MVTLYNPHVDDFFGEPTHFRLFKRRPLKKYGFFIDEALKVNKKVNILVDGTSSAFVPEKIFHRLPKCIRNTIATLEYNSWHRLNKYNCLVTRVFESELDFNDVLFAFSYKSATGNFNLRKDLLSKYRIVVFHLSHYFISTVEKSRNLSLLDNVLLAGDSNILEIPYFKEHFSWYHKHFLVLPFAVTNRFYSYKEFSEREPRCLATGSFHDLTLEKPSEKYRDFINSTKSSAYHPIRKKIFENSSIVKEYIECAISPFRQYQNNNIILKSLNHFKISQTKYFSLDIVALYNNYQFAVVGEEVSGFPALGSFEAMACGAVLLGEAKYYCGLDVRADEHFIAHDGTLENIVEIIKSETNNHKKIRMISESAKLFIKKNYTTVAVYQKWSQVLSSV